MSTAITIEAGAMPDDRPIAWWLIATAALTFGMVVIGGITRLTESGLSITEWLPVMGVLPPVGDAAWQDAFDKYRQIPEYQQVHFGMSLAEFKGIFFWEYLHRLIGRLTGLVALLPPIIFLALGTARRSQWPSLLAVPVLVGLQGLLGWYMVKSGLSVRTSVSQYRLTAHLTLALTLYGYCVWRASGLLGPGRAAETRPWLRRGAWAIVALVALTILAGGFTAGTKAGLAYNTFPLMDGRLVPSGYFIEQPWWLNPFENVAAVQFDHRLLAVTTFTAVCSMWVFGRSCVTGTFRRHLDLLMGAAVLQVALGISTLLLVVPVPLAALHQSGAVLVLTMALLVLRDVKGSRTLPSS